MIKIRLVLFLLFLISSLGIVLFYFKSDYYKNKSRINRVETLSGLDFPKSTEILDFKEIYTFTGEGYLAVDLKIDKTNFEYLISQSKENGYKKLTSNNLVEDTVLKKDSSQSFIFSNIDLEIIKEGYYKFVLNDGNRMDYVMSLLDVSNNKAFIYASFP